MHGEVEYILHHLRAAWAVERRGKANALVADLDGEDVVEGEDGPGGPARKRIVGKAVPSTLPGEVGQAVFGLWMGENRFKQDLNQEAGKIPMLQGNALSVGPVTKER
jgi:hypothetical protein